jgi:chromosome segregation ATPase
MIHLRLVAALGTTAFLRRPAFAFGLALFFALAASAQQPAIGRQKVPRLSTDDVSRPPAMQPVEESKEGAAKTEDDKKPGEPVATTGQPAADGEKVSAEELSWRDRVGKARNRAKELERAAEEAELRITTLRNELGTSGQSSRYRNDTAAELDQAGRRLIDLRADAKAAADDLAELVEYGRQKGFAEAAAPQPTSEGGKPNEQYFRARLDKLTGDIESAQRRVSLYENRVRDISQRIIMNGGKKGGDNFYIAQLQQDRADAQAKLDEARAALTKAQADLEALKEEARRANVSRDLFR